MPPSPTFDNNSRKGTSPVQIAFVHIGLGEKDAAFKMLEKHTGNVLGN